MSLTKKDLQRIGDLFDERFEICFNAVFNDRFDDRFLFVFEKYLVPFVDDRIGKLRSDLESKMNENYLSLLGKIEENTKLIGSYLDKFATKKEHRVLVGRVQVLEGAA